MEVTLQNYELRKIIQETFDVGNGKNPIEASISFLSIHNVERRIDQNRIVPNIGVNYKMYVICIMYVNQFHY